MDILPLEIKAPLQSWGTQSRFFHREAGRFPSRSGIIGMIASAMGITREQTDDLQTLNGLDIAVRIDDKGQRLTDFQIMNTSETGNPANKIINRDYIEDASFLVGVYGEYDLEKVAQALKNPRYALFFGRKSCPPVSPITKGVEQYEDIHAFLKEYPLLTKKYKIPWNQREEEYLTLKTVVTHEKGDFTADDNPYSFSTHQRIYEPRKILFGTAEVKNPYYKETLDPMSIVENEENIYVSH